MKMTRAEKRRRKLAKIVEMRLDGMKDDDIGFDWRSASFEELYERHRAYKAAYDYYGMSVTQRMEEHKMLNLKAKELMWHVDEQILKEAMNGKPS